MYNNTHFSLSIEELAALFHLIGERDQGLDLLKLVDDSIDESSLEIYYLTAAHSLAARGWLTVNNAEQRNQLDQNLENAVRVVANPVHSLSINKIPLTEKSDPVGYLIHVHNGKYVLLDNKEGIVFKLDFFEQLQPVIRESIKLVNVPEGASLGTKISGKLPSEFVENIGEFIPLEVDSIKDHLFKQGLDEELSNLLSGDLKSLTSIYSIMKIQYQNDGAVSDHGVMIIESKERSWLLTYLEDSNGFFTVIPFTEDAFTNILETII